MPADDIFDVAIVGLGPAGAILARHLGGSRLRVVAIDKKSDGGGFRKPCGGLIAHDAQLLMARLGLALPVNLLVDPQIFAVRALDLPSGMERHYQRFYLNLDRARFDAWLISLIPPSVIVHDDARCDRIEETPDGFVLTCRKGGETRTLAARNVVGADGAGSLVRRLCFKRPIRTYVCIQEWFERRDDEPYYQVFFDPAVTDCYAWGNVKDDRWVLGAALPADKPRRRFDRLKSRLADCGRRLDAPSRVEACLVSRPASMRELVAARRASPANPGRGAVFLVGEAAGLVSPSSLEGISYAMESGWRLALALSGTSEPVDAYCSSFQAMRWRIGCKRLKTPFLYWPPLRRLVLKSGFRAITVAPFQK